MFVFYVVKSEEEYIIEVYHSGKLIYKEGGFPTREIAEACMVYYCTGYIDGCREDGYNVSRDLIKHPMHLN